jgi:hypothetical protein
MTSTTKFTITGLASPIFPGILCIAWISDESTFTFSLSFTISLTNISLIFSSLFSGYNMGLITRLRNGKELESAWYFNCSVYGKTFDEKRIKFDIFDDINNKIAKRQ